MNIRRIRDRALLCGLSCSGTVLAYLMGTGEELYYVAVVGGASALVFFAGWLFVDSIKKVNS